MYVYKLKNYYDQKTMKCKNTYSTLPYYKFKDNMLIYRLI